MDNLSRSFQLFITYQHSEGGGEDLARSLGIVAQFFLADPGNQRVLFVKIRNRIKDRQFQCLECGHLYKQLADSRDFGAAYPSSNVGFDHLPRPSGLRSQCRERNSSLTSSRDSSPQNGLWIAFGQSLQECFAPRHSRHRRGIEHRAATDSRDRRELPYDETVSWQQQRGLSQTQLR